VRACGGWGVFVVVVIPVVLVGFWVWGVFLGDLVMVDGGGSVGGGGGFGGFAPLGACEWLGGGRWGCNVTTPSCGMLLRIRGKNLI